MICLKRPGHATELCAKMNLTQFNVVCPVGGDGTIHECVNGTLLRDILIALTIHLQNRDHV